MYTCMTINIYFYCLYGISLRYGNEAVFVCVCVCMCMQALVSCGKIILQDTPLSLSFSIHLHTSTLDIECGCID